MVFLNANISAHFCHTSTHQPGAWRKAPQQGKVLQSLLAVGSPSILIVIPCWKIYVNQLMFQCVNKTLDGLNSPQVFESWKLTKRANKCTKKQQQQQFAVSDDSIIDRTGYLSMGAAMRHCQLQWGSIFQEHFTISLTQFSVTFDQGESNSEKGESKECGLSRPRPTFFLPPVPHHQVPPLSNPLTS